MEKFAPPAGQRSHWKVGAGLPVASTVNVALPLVTAAAAFVGWRVMTGALGPEPTVTLTGDDMLLAPKLSTAWAVSW